MKQKIDILSVLMIVFVLLRLINYFYAVSAFQVLSAGILIAISIYMFPKVKTATRLVLSIIFLVGASLLIYSGANPREWLRAVLQNGNVIMLLICVPMISMPFYYEDYQGELKKLVQVRMRNVMGFLGLVTVCVNILGGLIAVGATLVVFTLLKPYASMYKADKLFIKTLLRGYYASGFWSPAWATVIIYSVFSDVKWIRVLPVAVIFVLLFNVMNLLGIHFEIRRSRTNFELPEAEKGAGYDRKKIDMMILLAVVILAAIMIVNAATGWDLMLVVCIVSAAFPLAAALIQRRTGPYRSLAKNYFEVSVPKIKEQVAVFMLAGFLGRALDISGAGLAMVELLPDWFHHNTPAMIAALIIIMTLPSLAGVHPTAMGTTMVAVLHPAALGLANYTFALALLAGWIVALLVAPFSATALIISGETGQSSFAHSVLLNWRFAIVCAVVYSLLISVIGPLM